MNLIRKRLQIIAFTLLLSVITVIGANVISDSNNKVASTEVKAAITIPAYKGKSYNVQKGVTINYSDGSSHLSNKKISNKTPTVNKNVKYVWIPKSGTKYHYKKSCSGMKNPSKVKVSVAKKKGYTACKKCVK